MILELKRKFVTTYNQTEMSYAEQIDKTRVPRHVAIIMDGNGRWAKERNLDRSLGHRKGLEVVREITDAACTAGVKYLTVYAFSTENWNRPEEEVNALMSLVIYGIEQETPDLIKNGVRLNVIGDTRRLPEEVGRRLRKCIEDTSAGENITLTLALSYSSRWELTEAARTIAARVKSGELALSEIGEAVVSGSLATASMPDPDLLIRTGGELRISNFLLWQLSYAEFYFTEEYWPDFSKESFYKAICDYQSRERRYGKTSEQL